MKLKTILEKFHYPDEMKDTKGQIIPCSCLSTAKKYIEHIPCVIVRQKESNSFFVVTASDAEILKEKGFEIV